MSALTENPIPASDQTWLHMDRPNNLMVVRALMWFDGEPELDAVRAVISERLIGRYPVFSRCAVERDGNWFWADDKDFDLHRHVRLHQLGGDDADLRRWMGERFAEPFDADRPLWDATLVTDVEGWGTVLFCRFHHALADGVRLTQLMFSLCDALGEEQTPAAVGRPPSAGGLLTAGARAARSGVGDLADFAVGSLRWQLRTVTGIGPRMFSPRSLKAGVDVARDPMRVLDLVEGVASSDNTSVNTAAEVTRAMAAPRATGAVWSGTPGVDKEVLWITDLALDRIKRIGRDVGGTVNDVLMGLVSRGVSHYLEEHGTPQREIAWLVPVSLLPFDDNLPEELGNHFSLVFTPMPLQQEDLAAAIAAMRERMERLKNSLQPVITFGVQWMIAQTPQSVAYRLTNYFANKSVGVLTNVPGPRQQVAFAGVPVAGVLGWAPQSGDQVLGVCIFSYAGQVSIGIAADAGLVPAPELLANRIREEFDNA